MGLHRQDLSEFVDLVAEVLILGLELSDQGILHGNSMGVLSRSLSIPLIAVSKLVRRGSLSQSLSIAVRTLQKIAVAVTDEVQI